MEFQIYIYIYTSVQSPTLSSLEKRPQNLDICADTGIGICFPLHLCVVFLFLVWYSHPSFRLPPAASFNLSSTSSSHTAYSSKHNLLTHTHNLSKTTFPYMIYSHTTCQLAHIQLVHTQLIHTHTLCLHTSCPPTSYSYRRHIHTYSHTTYTHTYTRLTHTQLVQHYLFTHTHNFFRRKLLITWCGSVMIMINL